MNSRDKLLDYSKAISIILVIYSHCGSPFCGNFVSAIHIPTFFVISGLLCERQIESFQPYDIILKKMKSLLCPWYVMGAISAFLFWLLNPEYKEDATFWIRQFKRFTLGMYYRNISCVTGVLWFLIVLFDCYIIFIIAYHIKGTTAILITNLFCFILSLPLSSSDISLPFSIEMLPFVFPLFSFGWYIKKYSIYSRIKEISLNQGLLFVSFSFIYIFILTEILGIHLNTFKHQYSIPIVYYFVGIIGSVLIFVVSHFVMMLITNVELLDKMLCFIGRNSIIYMIFHLNFIIPVLDLTELSSTSSEWLSTILYTLICIIVSSLIAFAWTIIRSIFPLRHPK